MITCPSYETYPRQRRHVAIIYVAFEGFWHEAWVAPMNGVDDALDYLDARFGRDMKWGAKLTSRKLGPTKHWPWEAVDAR